MLQFYSIDSNSCPNLISPMLDEPHIECIMLFPHPLPSYSPANIFSMRKRFSMVCKLQPAQYINNNCSLIMSAPLSDIEPWQSNDNYALILYRYVLIFQASFHDITVPNVYFKIEQNGFITYSKRYYTI